MSADSSALNWYTGRLATALTESASCVTVIGPHPSGKRAATWFDGRVRVQSRWLRSGILGAIQAGIALAGVRDGVVHVEHELFAFGSASSAFCFAGFQALAKIRRPIVTTVHGVLSPHAIDRAFVARNGIRLPAWLVRRMYTSLIRAVTAFSNIVHVHEVAQARELESEFGVDADKIHVIPFGIDERYAKIDKRVARERLQLPVEANVLTFFGFLSSYKGIEYLISELSDAFVNDPSLHVVIAGREPTRLDGVASLDDVIRNCGIDEGRLTRLGFVDEPQVPDVFCAADALIMPYTVSMSASGPLNIAAGLRVPVLLSDAFESVLPKWPLMFSIQRGAASRTIGNFFSSSENRGLCLKAINEFAVARTWDACAKRLEALYLEA